MSAPTLVGLLATFVNAVLSLVIAFGVTITATQAGAIIAAFNAAAAVAIFLVHVYTRPVAP